MNVIGDIAGNYKTLMALLNKMPDDEPVSIGDMVDRGPNSKEVIEFFMNNGRAILGNHEHMMLDLLNRNMYYEDGVWMFNGGYKTLQSFGVVPDEVKIWLENLPTYIKEKNILISHAFVHPKHIDIDVASDLGNDVDDPDADISIIWNRSEPVRREEYSLQLAGHNSQFGLREFSDELGRFAICLDSSAQSVLTGINTDTLEIFQQEYID